MGQQCLASWQLTPAGIKINSAAKGAITPLKTAPPIVTLAVLATTNVARTDVILEKYEFQGQPGTEAILASRFVATNLFGTNFGDAGVIPLAAPNLIDSTGWNGFQAA